MDTGLKKEYDIIEKKLRNNILTEKQARRLIKKQIIESRESYINYLRNFQDENAVRNFKRFFGFYWDTKK